MTTEPTVTQALLPCPFCGEPDEGHLLVCDNTGPKLCTNAHAFVRCEACSTDGPEAETVSGAITAWNTRTPSLPEDVVALIGRLRGHAKGLREYERYHPDNRCDETCGDCVSYAGLLDEAADALDHLPCDSGKEIDNG